MVFGHGPPFTRGMLRNLFVSVDETIKKDGVITAGSTGPWKINFLDKQSGEDLIEELVHPPPLSEHPLAGTNHENKF